MSGAGYRRAIRALGLRRSCAKTQLQRCGRVYPAFGQVNSVAWHDARHTVNDSRSAGARSYAANNPAGRKAVCSLHGAEKRMTGCDLG